MSKPRHYRYCKARRRTEEITMKKIEKLKIIPSKVLAKDPFWQVALRDERYRCDLSVVSCKLAGCHRCNPKKK